MNITSSPFYSKPSTSPHESTLTMNQSIAEIDGILGQYADPTGELFRRYTHKSDEEQEAFIPALIGERGIPIISVNY